MILLSIFQIPWGHYRIFGYFLSLTHNLSLKVSHPSFQDCLQRVDQRANLVKALRKALSFIHSCSYFAQLIACSRYIGMGNDCCIQVQIPNLYYHNTWLPSSVFASSILLVYYYLKSLIRFGDISGFEKSFISLVLTHSDYFEYRERPDTIRSIVANLVGDDDSGDSLVDENEPIQPLQQPEAEDYTDSNWEPEPIDAGPGKFLFFFLFCLFLFYFILLAT